MNSLFYNAHHSPIGAFATLTLGSKGSMGGLGLELAGPANEEIYIGLEDREGGQYSAFPFYENSAGGSMDYDVEGHSEFTRPLTLSWFKDEEIERTIGPSCDEWCAGDLTLRIYSPVREVPDPASVPAGPLKDAVAPAICAELVIDNRWSKRPRKAFIGYRGTERAAGMRVIEEEGLTGIAQHTYTAIASDDPQVYAGIGFQPEAILDPTAADNLPFLVGNLGLLVGEVPAGEIRTFRFAIGFYREGTATTGIRTRYLYRRFFDRIEDVLMHALHAFEGAKRQSVGLDGRLKAQLTPERFWMLAQAIRSYLGSTQLLEKEDGAPLWVVNEGEYRMMNTFDLTVDQAFIELSLNPWTVRNVLDQYAERYAYEDHLRKPGSDHRYPGGISFTHDMGVANVFSRSGHSGYEQSGLTGCFSYMSAEELMNWVLTAGLYESCTNDLSWAVSRRETFSACLRSLVARDDPEPDRRNGLIGLDAARCQGGSEITTYDSLDASLGQARNNLYLGVKGWATYRLLEQMLLKLGEEEGSELAKVQAAKAVDSICNAADKNGLLPAVIGEGVEARIIPAIEGLVYPYVVGLSIDERLKSVLASHFGAVLKPGICRFDDGGWKLSSTSSNSWLSKIYLCQFVAERILGHGPDDKADKAHRAWLLDPENAYYAWSDQMLDGKAVGSRYYPRGVTSILWASSGDRPLRELTGLLTESAFDYA
jgi:hypothetical protein